MASFANDYGMQDLLDGTADYNTSTIKLRLVASSATPTKSDANMSSFSSIGTDQTLGTKSVAVDATNHRVLLKAANATFSAVAGGSTVGWAIVYYDDGGNGVPLFAHDVADTPTNGGDITIDWPVVNSTDGVCGYSTQ